MTEEVACSFCFKTRDEVQALVQGKVEGVLTYICDECVEKCKKSLREPVDDLVS